MGQTIDFDEISVLDINGIPFSLVGADAAYLEQALILDQPGSLTIHWLNKSLVYEPSAHFFGGDVGVRFEVGYYPDQQGEIKRGIVFFYGDTRLPAPGTVFPISMSTVATAGPTEGDWVVGANRLEVRWRKLEWDGGMIGGGSFIVKNIQCGLPAPQFSELEIKSFEKV